MNKPTSIAIIVVIIVAVAGAAFLTHRFDAKHAAAPTNSSSAGTTGTSSAATSTSNQGAVTGHIEIASNSIFTPSQITVHKGEAVVWTNNDNTVHTVTDDLKDAGGPDSGNIAPGTTYTFTFTKTGSFQYHCELHHEMRGTIVVN